MFYQSYKRSIAIAEIASMDRKLSREFNSIFSCNQLNLLKTVKEVY